MCFCFSLGLGWQAHAAVWISEFVADNTSGFRTAAATYSDWIELANSGSAPVDLSGWHLTDNAAQLEKWTFPQGTTIPAKGYLIVFADSSPFAITNNELHANFSLSKDGEYLALVQADGTTVADEFAPQYPPQLPNISYGHSVYERELISADSAFRYRIPTAAGDPVWASAAGGIGFGSTNGTFTFHYYEMNSPITGIDVAENMVANPGFWRTNRGYPISSQSDFINFGANNSPGGNFSNNVAFPGSGFSGEATNNVVLTADGALLVPSPGLWTFAVGSADGFRLRIVGHGVSFVSEYTTVRSFDTTLSTFNFPVAGVYRVYLTYFQSSGASSVECSVARDFQSEFAAGTFNLVGDPASGVPCASLVGSGVDTDVGPVMQSVNSRLDAEWTFTLSQAPAAGDTVLLGVRASDGFSAELNGVALASLNAPESLAWNSTATVSREPEVAVQWFTYPAAATLLRQGTNTLTIVGLNNSAADPDFLLQARLSLRTAQTFAFYFKIPTPRAANSKAYNAPTQTVISSEPRGYKTAPFTVTLRCDDPSAVIRYTTDGSVPKTNSPAYTLPLTITKTTTLRAAVVDPASVRQNVTTRTWLFLEDILRQGTTPPAGWPASRQVNNHIMEYGLNQAVVTADPVRLRNGMTNTIPSISLVTDLPNLFSAQTGIYVNPGNDGLSWERPVSVEFIDPVRGSGSELHIDAGIRIRGAYSRSPSNPKHSFRLFFRSDYGESKLRFPLFDDEGAQEFEKVDLRTSQNYSWAYENSTRDTFVRETFSRDSQRDMGMPYTRSRYYHLYLNGQYWGLYQTQERGDADYAETYLGGKNEDWDCIKTTQPGYTTTASDGTFTAFYALHNLAVNQGFTGAYTNNYWKARGLNPNGTRNPAYPVYLDQDNLMVYMLIAYYTGDPDSPVSIWGGMPNNMYALYNRLQPTGFKWLRHDAEHSLGSHSGYPVTCDTTSAGATFNSTANFNPAKLHIQLCAHPEYRLRFADLVQKQLYGDGSLNVTNSQNRFRSRMAEIDLAIIGESARWGRGKTRDATWLPECNSVVNSYFTQRRDILIGEFRARGWFPSMDAPAFSVLNDRVAPGTSVRISAPASFYYTLDGSDPRRPDGSINPSAIAVQGSGNPTGPRTLVQRGATWRYFDQGSEPAASGSLTWRDPGYPDAGWPAGPAVLGVAGSATVNAVATTTQRYVNGTSAPQVTTTYFRHTFQLDKTDGITDLSIDLLRDDGAVIYLNGSELLRDNMNAGATSYDMYAAATVGSPAQNTYFTRTVSLGNLLHPGTNTLAVEVHQANASSSDLYFDFAMTAPAIPVLAATNVPMTNAVAFKARAYSAGEWSALSESAVTVAHPPSYYSGLRVSEMMYAPPAAPVGSLFETDDFAWLELVNTGTTPMDLAEVGFVTGITNTFGPMMLAPRGRLVLAKNVAAFASEYATSNLVLLPWASGSLARRGEILSLAGPSSSNILTFAYSGLWYPETVGTGYSLVAFDLAASEPAWSSPENWRPGRTIGGTPGFPEPPSFTSTQLTSDRRYLVVEVSGVEGILQLLGSPDLRSWKACDPAAWSRSGNTITIDLQHPSLASGDLQLFRFKLLD